METLKQQLTRQEARKVKPYDDKTGKELKPGDVLRGNLTIGIGWNLTNVPLPDEVVDRLFEIAMHNAEFELVTRLPWTAQLDPVRRDVLLNMTFNMGINKVLGFKRMLAAAEQSKWEEAAKEGLASTWAVQVGSRATELMEQLRTGRRQR